MNDPLVDDPHKGAKAKEKEAKEASNMTMFEVSYMGFPHLCAIALKDIQPNDELLYSYGAAYWDGGGTKERRRNEQHSKVIRELRTFVQTKLEGKSEAHSIVLDAKGK